jgi:hypothetical protein
MGVIKPKSFESMQNTPRPEFRKAAPPGTIKSLVDDSLKIDRAPNNKTYSNHHYTAK